MVLAYYYIANNKIMQAPSAHQVTHARLQRCTFALQQGFARLQADLEPLTRQAKQLARQAAKEEQRQQQQQAVAAAPAAQQQAAAQEAQELPAGPLPPHGAAVTATTPSGAPATAAAAAPGSSYTTYATAHPYGATVDLESPSMGTLRAPLAAPLPEVMAAAAAAAPAAAGGGVPVRRHLTDADRARWNKLDRILSHQFSSLSRIKYTALPPEYLQRLHQQMYGLPPPQPPPATTAAAAVATPQPAGAAAQ